MATIDDLIDPRLVLLDLDGIDRDEAIRRLTAALHEAGRVTDPEAFIQAVLAREEETGGTGMGSGIAIPHAKSEGVAAASVAVGRSSTGLDFGAEEEGLADLVLLIAAPAGEDDLHVTVLSRLARRLIHESFRTSLREAATPDDVIAILQREIEL
jgi:fructose PTS system EIIA component